MELLEAHPQFVTATIYLAQVDDFTNMTSLVVGRRFTKPVIEPMIF